jgi:hypothetical protein
MEPVTVPEFIEQIKWTHEADIAANCRFLFQNVIISSQAKCAPKKAYTVTVNSYFLDMFNAQYMFAVCFALLDAVNER